MSNWSTTAEKWAFVHRGEILGHVTVPRDDRTAHRGEDSAIASDEGTRNPCYTGYV